MQHTGSLLSHMRFFTGSCGLSSCDSLRLECVGSVGAYSKEHVGSSTRDRIYVPYIARVDSQPLDHHSKSLRKEVYLYACVAWIIQPSFNNHFTSMYFMGRHSVNKKVLPVFLLPPILPAIGHQPLQPPWVHPENSGLDS